MFNKSKKEVLALLKSDETKGLTRKEAEDRLSEYGNNELTSKKKVSLFVRFLLQFKDILVIVLLIAALISIVVDPSEWVDSLIILIVVIFNSILGVVQESRAEKSLEALKKMSSPLCKVLRDGSTFQIETKDLVPGDIIMVDAGDYVPADSRIIDSYNLKVDESALTGESVPVDKINSEINKKELAIGDKKNILFSSTFVTYGRGKAIVFNTGMNTEIGKIASMLDSEEQKATPLQNKMEQIGKMMGIVAIAICAVVFVLQYIAGQDILEAFKTAVALAVAAIPEGLAAVVTIILSIGVSKMVKQKAIVKKLPAVETLGCTSIVCSDKTGTLTQNKMTVVEIYENKTYKSEDFSNLNSTLATYAAICSDAKVEEVDGIIKRIGDPTETALIDANNIFGKDKKENYERVLEVPFDSERKMMSVVIKTKDGFLSITKGAPDVVFSISDASKDMIEINNNMASRALRVLAVAVKTFKEIPTDNSLIEKDLHFIGLIGMIDPAREEVKPAIEIAKRAGVKTIMITGDHVITAKAIATNLGIFNEGDIALTTHDLSKMSDEELDKDLDKITVYARVAPSDKVRIVKAWQKRNQVVAMTGDGVNDSPALKAADIGCAMGITGTDVSKEAAAMILVDDNFATIISAIKQGRNIYENIRKCVKYLVSSNIGEVLTIFVVSLLTLILNKDLGVPLLPIHLLWINLITDSLPAFAIGMEEAGEDLMDEKPRPKNESFFARGLGSTIILEGIFVGTITIIAYFIGHGHSDLSGHTMAFVTLALTQLFHSFNVKSDRSVFSKQVFNNKFLIFSFIIGVALQMIVLYVPGINDLFKLEALSFGRLAISVGLAFSIILVVELAKLIKRKIRNNNNY